MTDRRLAALERRVGSAELKLGEPAEQLDRRQPPGVADEPRSIERAGAVSNTRESRDPRNGPALDAQAAQDSRAPLEAPPAAGAAVHGEQPQAGRQAAPASGADPSSSDARAERAAQLKERSARASESARARGGRRRGGRTSEKGSVPPADEDASAPAPTPEKLARLARKHQTRGRPGGKKRATAAPPDRAPESERGLRAEPGEEPGAEPGTD